MNRLLLHYALFILITGLLAGCATVVAPEGGPKDSTPPVALDYSPANKVRNYSGEKIQIRFDEFIQLKDLNSQLVVSPAMPENPDVFVKGKKLIIQPPDSLEPNTTYTIFLGNSVINFTESLPVRNFQFVLATGQHLDSLRITGTISEAFNRKAAEGILIMLYKNANDSAPYTQKPYYIAKSFGQGEFILDNLSEGKYQIFALKDLNSNYLYDQPTEEIGFIDSLIIPGPAKPNDDTLNLITPVRIDMKLFREVEKKQGVQSYKVLSEKLAQIVFKRPVENVGFKLSDTLIDSKWYHSVLSPNRDTLDLWFTNTMSDTAYVEVSDNQQVLDTLRLVLRKPKKETDRNRLRRGETERNVADTLKTKEVVWMKVSNHSGQEVDFFAKPSLKFLTPLNSFNASDIKLYKMVDSLLIPINFEPIHQADQRADLLFLDAKLEESTRYKVFCRDSTFIDIFDHANDTIDFQFVTTKKRNYGSLALSIETRDSIPLLIQVLNDKDAVVQQLTFSGNLVIIPYLRPGNYKIKAIADENQNQKWDTGNYQEKKQPEKVYILDQTINIRANWDVEQKWIIEEK